MPHVLLRTTAASSVLTLAIALSVAAPVSADGAGAFIGGVIAARVIRNVEDRTEAEQQQAAAASRQANAAQAPRQPSSEQRIKELDKLAAGGYITPEEYKRKKQAIVNDI